VTQGTVAAAVPSSSHASSSLGRAPTPLPEQLRAALLVSFDLATELAASHAPDDPEQTAPFPVANKGFAKLADSDLCAHLSAIATDFGKWPGDADTTEAWQSYAKEFNTATWVQSGSPAQKELCVLGPTAKELGLMICRKPDGAVSEEVAAARVLLVQSLADGAEARARDAELQGDC
jgi:hypothetical protein